MKRALQACGVAVSAFAVGTVLTAVSTQAATAPGWRIVTTATQATQFSSVSASGAGNAWAVGEGRYGALVIRHWTGSAWQAIAPPTGLTNGGNMVHVAAVAATTGQSAWVFANTWASGSNATGPVTAMEWSGKWIAKKVFPVKGVLEAAVASGPKDVWTFGAVITGSSPGKATPWAYHLNGTTWFKVAAPLDVWDAEANPRAGDWIMGRVFPQPKSGPVTKIMHWTSSGWKVVPLPKITVPAGQQILPGGIAAISQTSVWAAVTVGAGAGPGPATHVLMHWNGKAWTRISLPKAMPQSGLGFVGDGNGGLWVISHTSSGSAPVFRYSAGKWTRAGTLPGTGILLESLTSIPGTKSVLGGASLAKTDPGVGVILKYGP